jgi:predicted nucleotidyltransferase
MGLFRLAAIHLRLEEVLGQRVDLVTEHGLIDRYRRRIVPDLIRAG